jgi:PiT family inorganic phosphate transporter
MLQILLKSQPQICAMGADGDHGSGLQWSTVRSIAAAWVLTLPAAMMIAGVLYFALRQVV